MDFAGGAVGGALNFAGAVLANKANKQMAREQMQFQERMSNTAYQRSMEDMRKAGLNPILAYNQGGASSPPGATSQSQNVMSGAVSSALDARRSRYEIENMKEQNNLLHDQAAAARAQAAKTHAEFMSIPLERELIAANTAKSVMEAKKTQSDMYRQWVDTALNISPLKWLMNRNK